jgi:glycosyltransferase involved in cell wall biosynthesis
MNAQPSVVYVLPDKLGGMLNIVRALLANRAPDGLRYHAVLTDNLLSTDTRFSGSMGADGQCTVRYRSPTENLFAVLRRLRAAIPDGGGVLVSNDQVELALAHAYDLGRAVVQILHGDHDYYYDLAARHEGVIDAFVAYSAAMRDGLRRRLPHRHADIHHLPYGVALPPRVRQAHPGALRLVFAGRLEHGQKGVFDLPSIDAALRRRGVEVAWTMIGGGPDAEALAARFRGPHVRYEGALSHDQTLARLSDFDVFVLPTRAEGFPVALVEAMGAGLVPVVSDIPSGVPEVVEGGRTGLLPRVGDVEGFADAIASLDRDRGRLESMSAACRDVATTRFDPRARTREYQALYARWQTLRRPRPAHTDVPYCTRLDRPWIPNLAVKTVRTLIRRAQGRPA